MRRSYAYNAYTYSLDLLIDDNNDDNGKNEDQYDCREGLLDFLHDKNDDHGG